ncbi:MAG TPA: cyclic nucleotide-binding domain-containing protein [Candidatus Limnocylindria bacterium]|nr:cyclic nucleotide-binding domain-containing protein [Candidatus Limnocylindria bacterium]
MTVELAQQLASVPLLAGLNDRVRRRLADIGKRRSYNPDDAIVREGSAGTALYIVLSGRARVERAGEVLGELKAGDFFGELALIEEHPRSASVIAAEPTDCLLFPAWEFTALLEEHPEVAVPIMRVLIARLHRREHHKA